MGCPVCARGRRCGGLPGPPLWGRLCVQRKAPGAAPGLLPSLPTGGCKLGGPGLAWLGATGSCRQRAVAGASPPGGRTNGRARMLCSGPPGCPGVTRAVPTFLLLNFSLSARTHTHEWRGYLAGVGVFFWGGDGDGGGVPRVARWAAGAHALASPPRGLTVQVGRRPSSKTPPPQVRSYVGPHVAWFGGRGDWRGQQAAHTKKGKVVSSTLPAPALPSVTLKLSFHR